LRERAKKFYPLPTGENRKRDMRRRSDEIDGPVSQGFISAEIREEKLVRRGQALLLEKSKLYRCYRRKIRIRHEIRHGDFYVIHWLCPGDDSRVRGTIKNEAEHRRAEWYDDVLSGQFPIANPPLVINSRFAHCHSKSMVEK
jgi:hypothetical protein